MPRYVGLGLFVTLWLALAVRADDGIPAKVLGELKAATVYVKVEGDGWSATGSGFLIQVDRETGLVATNHHVVSDPSRKSYGKVSLMFRSGTKKEMTLPAEILASDPD